MTCPDNGHLSGVTQATAESRRLFGYIAGRVPDRLGSWNARSDFARDIGDEPENSRRIAGPSMGEAQSARYWPSVPDRCH
jgi:hypothetical protein